MALLTRRLFLMAAGASALLLGVAKRPRLGMQQTEAAASDSFEVVHTDAEWRQLLAPEQYAVLRHEGTEIPFTSPLNDEHRAGHFACAGCALDVFSSQTKFDSGTGWPSFWQPLTHAVTERSDDSLGMTRTEVHCRRCGGHLGHVFDDGPQPTGLRYCMNGIALSFNPGAA